MSATTTSTRTSNGFDGAEKLPCMNPAPGALIREIPIATAAEIEAMAARAREACPSWSGLSVERRGELLLRARDGLVDRREEVLDLLVQETGKARMDALADLLVLGETISYYTSHGPGLLADKTVSARLLKNKRIKVQHMPRGLVVNISPWNYPLDLAWSPLIPALLAGNVVINKPSEVTPLISLKFLDILREAGLPEAVAQVAVGFGDVGAALIDRADYVAFTGSVATGRKVAVRCAERLVPNTLELGGKDPAIVLEDANLERAASGVVYGAFFNSGQTCTSIERVYVVEEVYEDFVDRVIRLTRTLRQGVDAGFTVEVGAMIFPRQLEIVEQHLKDAVAKGAQVRTGGRRNPDFPSGYFFEPTVLTEVDHTMDVMVEETFGPILPIMKVRDAAEALEHANASDYGLNSSVWTGDKDRGRAIARRLEAGNVCINDCLINYTAIEAPFGGVKNSGIGRRKGEAELLKYCHAKTVLEDIFGASREPTWYPYSRAVGEGAVKAIGVLYRSGLGNKLRNILG